MLQNFQFARYRFTYTVQEPLRMPHHKGNVFRGRFGYILRHITCIEMTREGLNGRVDGLSERIEGIEKIITWLMVLIVVAVGIPQMITRIGGVQMNSIFVRVARLYSNSVLLVVATFFFISPAMGELSVEDLEKIDKIIQQSEKRMKDHITQEREKLDIKIQSVDKLVDRNFYFLLSLIALIVVAVGVPQILLTLRDKKYDNLLQEVERLK